MTTINNCIFYFLKPGKVSFDAPSTVQGWVRRCHDVLENFEYLLEDGEQGERKKERINSLQKIIDRSEDQSIGFLKTKGVKFPDKEQLEKVLGIKKSNQRIFKGGKIYDPRSGNTYKSNLYLNDDGSLKVEGCLAFICDGEEWQPLIVTINEDGTKDAVLKNSPQKT